MKIVRVELHGSDNYTALHREMAGRGFSRTVRAIGGLNYHLPTAEYLYDGLLTSDQVLGLAQTAVNVLGLRASILCTDGAVMFSNLLQAA
jgi:hypothetical protein